MEPSNLPQGCKRMDRKARTVLIVDGSVTMLNYYGILLKRLEYTVLTATRPEDALKTVELVVPSLVLTALSFPQMTGIDFIKALKGSELTRSIPVLVLTAVEDNAVMSACLNAGASAYLIKPVEPGHLYRTIQAATESTPRENIRINTSLKVVLEEGAAGEGGPKHYEYATTISEGGLYLRTLSPKPKDALTPVRILIGDREIQAKAVVLYTCFIKDGLFKEPGMAIKFLEISEEDRNYVRGFIKDQLTSDLITEK
jgi:CheY-like chemotaxis protein